MEARSRKQKKEYRCKLCVGVFRAKSCYERRGGNKYCSQKCYHVAKRKRKRTFVGNQSKERFLSAFSCIQCSVTKLVRPCIAKKRQFCSLNCLMKSRIGSRNSNWKGGIKPENKAIRDSEEYFGWRKLVFERDNYTCQECGQVGWSLHADHIKPFALFPEERFNVANGRTLCKACHFKKPRRFRNKLAFYQYASSIV